MYDDPKKHAVPLPEWRGAFTNEELNALHAEGFGHRLLQDDWVAQVERHSLGWVCLRLAGQLVGFVNVAWDGGVHAFLLDTVIADPMRRKGLATSLVEEAVRQAKATGWNGCTSISIHTCVASTSMRAAFAPPMPG